MCHCNSYTCQVLPFSTSNCALDPHDVVCVYWEFIWAVFSLPFTGLTWPGSSEYDERKSDEGRCDGVELDSREQQSCVPPRLPKLLDPFGLDQEQVARNPEMSTSSSARTISRWEISVLLGSSWRVALCLTQDWFERGVIQLHVDSSGPRRRPGQRSNNGWTMCVMWSQQ